MMKALNFEETAYWIGEIALLWLNDEGCIQIYFSTIEMSE